MEYSCCYFYCCNCPIVIIVKSVLTFTIVTIKRLINFVTTAISIVNVVIGTIVITNGININDSN